MSGTFLNDIEKFHRIQTVGRNDKGMLQKTRLQKFCIGLITIHNKDHTYTFDKYNPFRYLRKIFMYLLEGLS